MTVTSLFDLAVWALSEVLCCCRSLSCSLSLTSLRLSCSWTHHFRTLPGAPPLAALTSICIHFHDCPMPVSLPLPLSPLHCLLALPSYYLPVHLALRQPADRIRRIRLLFSKPEAWLRGAVVEIVQVCAFTFFLGSACHFTNLPLPTLLSDGRGLIGITSVLLKPDFFSFCLWKY